MRTYKITVTTSDGEVLENIDAYTLTEKEEARLQAKQLGALEKRNRIVLDCERFPPPPPNPGADSMVFIGGVIRRAILRREAGAR